MDRWSERARTGCRFPLAPSVSTIFSTTGISWAERMEIGANRNAADGDLPGSPSGKIPLLSSSGEPEARDGRHARRFDIYDPVARLAEMLVPIACRGPARWRGIRSLSIPARTIAGSGALAHAHCHGLARRHWIGSVANRPAQRGA